VGPTGAVQTWAVAKEAAAKDATEVVGVGPVDSVKMAEYKAELNLYHKDTREYQINKEKVFVVILGQCMKAMKSTLANGGGLEKLEENKDVVGLLAKLQTCSIFNRRDTRAICNPYRERVLDVWLLSTKELWRRWPTTTRDSWFHQSSLLGIGANFIHPS
jgi:hypothetical protein